MTDLSNPFDEFYVPRPPRGDVFRELRYAALAGSVVGVPAALVLGLAGFPGWADDLASFALVLGLFVVPALTFRGLLHLVNGYVDRGRLERDPDRNGIDVRVSRWPIRVTGACATIYLWCGLASLVVNGDPTP